MSELKPSMKWAANYKSEKMPNKNKPSKSKAPRTIKTPEYKSFRLSKKIKPVNKKPLPGIVRLCKISFAPFKKDKKLFLGIIFFYFLFMTLLASGITSARNFVTVKDNLEQVLGGGIHSAGSIATLFTYALGSSGGSSSASSNYQVFISLLFSLAIIWSIRQVLAGDRIKIKQAFYQGMYPLVPFILVLFVIALQLIPALIGNFLLSTVLSNGLAVTFMEKSLWWLLFIMLSILSLYMLISSIFALYISTLPNMTPIVALRSARKLVLHRRLSVALRMLGLPVVILILYGLIMIPMIFILPILVIPLFILLNSFSLFFINSYLYNLYKELL